MLKGLFLTFAVVCGLAGAALATSQAIACPQGASHTTASNTATHHYGT